MKPTALLLVFLFASASGRAQPGGHRGTLGAGDPQLQGGEFYDTYSLDVRAGQTIEADLGSADFDPYLLVVAPSGAREANDDFEGSTARSRVQMQAAETGTYRVMATSYAGGETGAYVLALRVGGAGAAGAERASPAAPAAGPSAARVPGTSPAAGRYECMGDVPAYAGSTYVTGVGSIPNYTFSRQRLGEFTLAAGGTYRAGGGQAHPYTYDAATGLIRWQGGIYAAETVGESRYALDGEGRPVITIQNARTTWECRRP